MPLGAKAYWAIAAVAAGTFLTSADGSATSTILPVIGRAFRAGAGSVAWVTMLYLLVVTTLVLPAGRFSDRYGHRRAYLIGIGLYLVGTLCSGLAPSLADLIACRGITALGTALLLANAAAIVVRSCHASERGRYLGWLSTAAYLGLAVGPAASGWLADVLGWRGVYFALAPIAALALVLGVSRIPRYLPEQGAPGTTPAGDGRRPGERRALRLLADRHVIVAATAAVLASAALSCVTFLLPFWLWRAFAIGSGGAGLILSARATATALIAPLGGIAADRAGSRLPSVCGLLVMASGLAGLAITRGQRLPSIAAALATTGVGLGVFLPANHRVLMNAAARAGHSVASALLTFNRNLGMLCGTAIARWVLAANPAPKTVVVVGLRTAMHGTFVLAVGITVCGALVAFAGGTDRSRLCARLSPHPTGAT